MTRRELLSGWRAWLYRGRHRSPGRVGHLTGLQARLSMRLH